MSSAPGTCPSSCGYNPSGPSGHVHLLGTYQLDISTCIGTCPYHYGYVHWPWDISAGHIHVYWDMSISLWICPVALGHTSWTYPRPLGYVHIIMDITRAVGYSLNSRDMSIDRGHIHSPGKYPIGYDQRAGCIQLLHKLL